MMGVPVTIINKLKIESIDSKSNNAEVCDATGDECSTKARTIKRKNETTVN